MARRAIDGVAALLQSSTSWIPARTGRLSRWCRTHVSSHKSQVSLMPRSMRREWLIVPCRNKYFHIYIPTQASKIWEILRW